VGAINVGNRMLPQWGGIVFYHIAPESRSGSLLLEGFLGGVLFPWYFHGSFNSGLHFDHTGAVRKSKHYEFCRSDMTHFSLGTLDSHSLQRLFLELCRKEHALVSTA
jgi:hypothetical protein